MIQRENLLICKSRDLSLETLGMVAAPVTPLLGVACRDRGNPGAHCPGSLVKLMNFLFTKSSCLKKWSSEQLTMTPDSNLWPPHIQENWRKFEVSQLYIEFQTSVECSLRPLSQSKREQTYSNHSNQNKQKGMGVETGMKVEQASSNLQ